MENTVRCTDNENAHSYMGLSVDIPDNLPTEGISTGSCAYTIDTGKFFLYEETEKKWYEQ